MPGEAGAAVHTETAMAPGAGGSHPAADVLGAKLNFLLDSLKELEAGRARIVNLFDGLKATHVCPDHVRKLVAALPPPQSDTWEIYRDLLDHIRGFYQTLYFRRPSPPVWDRPIALVVERSLFDQESPPSSEVNADPNAKKPFRLFSEQYIRAAKSQRRVQEPVTNRTELVDLLEYLREGLRNGLADRGLGNAAESCSSRRSTRCGRNSRPRDSAATAIHSPIRDLPTAYVIFSACLTVTVGSWSCVRGQSSATWSSKASSLWLPRR